MAASGSVTPGISLQDIPSEQLPQGLQAFCGDIQADASESVVCTPARPPREAPDIGRLLKALPHGCWEQAQRGKVCGQCPGHVLGAPSRGSCVWGSWEQGEEAGRPPRPHLVHGGTHSLPSQGLWAGGTVTANIQLNVMTDGRARVCEGCSRAMGAQRGSRPGESPRLIAGLPIP